MICRDRAEFRSQFRTACLHDFIGMKFYFQSEFFGLCQKPPGLFHGKHIILTENIAEFSEIPLDYFRHDKVCHVVNKIIFSAFVLD